ncbi:PREDICTED: IgGFc-binding protein-like [Nanorana parkeri]|uniref:IgGFc-binding protein-like n=1 Tax=Nanorana parkeri TaxID=125878 RepID=UPI000854EBC5|nr:PREDICTED: IgGFc-binding protein-like [Nanorana parkeri]
MLLSGGKCVPISSCGCQYNGRYYEPNQSWYDEKCTLLCKCDPALGMPVCQPTSCKKSEMCMVADGKRGCYPTQYRTCIVSGDLHYTTFDKMRFNFMKTCIYQLVKVTSDDPSLVKFTMKVQNEHRGNRAVAFTKDVTLEAYNKTITVSKDTPRKIKVDGQYTWLPYYYESTKIAAYLSGSDVVLTTDFNLKLTFDGWSHVRVVLPSTYAAAVSGLCGNNNGDPSDDFTISNGVKANSAEEFGDHWKVGEVKGCARECTNCPKCTDAEKGTYKSDLYCGLLIKADGPFSQCHASVNPAPFFEDCLFDACAYKGHQSVVCNILASYVSECQKNGSMVKEWRTPSFCELTCPPNSHYKLLGNGCPATCFGLIAPPSCVPSYTEGCYCDNGFILSGEDCVPVPECGCVFENTYYKAGQEFYADTLCQRKCTCGANGITTCQDSPCGANAECKVVDGVLGCHPKEFGQCVAWGDPHYITPDGLYYSFQGTCAYKLIGIKKHTDFEVIVENEPYEKVAVTKSVTVRIDSYIIRLERGRGRTVLEF